MDKRLLVIAAGIAALLGIGAVIPAERWPVASVPTSAEHPLAKATSIWASKPFPFDLYFQDYKSDGDYLQYGQRNLCGVSDGFPLDDRGIALSRITGKGTYHPVLAAQCGLQAHGNIVRGKNIASATANMILYANHLIELQDDNGAFRYPFDYSYYDKVLPSGWVSAMAQGQALSLLSRAYSVTHDTKYLEAGKMALSFLLTSTTDGGVMTDMGGLDRSLSNYVFFEEYVSSPPNYTLNGYIFALLGLYDWSRLDDAITFGRNDAELYFMKGIETLKHILPYYDMGELTAYDLTYITFGGPPKIISDYHGVHIYLLHALSSIAGDPIFRETEEKWIGYVTSKRRG